MNRRLIIILSVTFFLAGNCWSQSEAPFYNGITEAAADARLSFPVSGIITAQHFAEGESVMKGEVICTLGHKTEELEVARQRVLLDNAMTDLKRTERLFRNTNSVSEEELDEKRAGVKVAETELAIAEEAVSRRLLVAPFSGVVADLYGLEVGEGAELLQPVVRLVDTNRAVFTANVPATAVDGLAPGAKVSLQIGQESCEGVVHFISPVLDPSSGLLTIKVTFENNGSRVRPGAAGQLRFIE